MRSPTPLESCLYIYHGGGIPLIIRPMPGVRTRSQVIASDASHVHEKRVAAFVNSCVSLGDSMMLSNMRLITRARDVVQGASSPFRPRDVRFVNFPPPGSENSTHR
jgi:hypothetical protein